MHALTGVAYMQLHLAAGPHPSASQDSTQLATWLHNFPLPARSPRLLPALRYAASMIREQVSTGLGMRSSPSDIGTDPQDFLCAVRLSVFLVKWLLLMACVPNEQPATGKQLVLWTKAFADFPPSEDEQRIIQSVRDAVQEATRCIEFEAQCDREDLMSTAIGVLEVMRHICQRCHREHISRFGKAFESYAAMLRAPGEDLLGGLGLGDEL